MDDIRLCGMARVREAVERLKRDGITVDALLLLCRAFGSVSSVGPEYLYPPDIREAILQGLSEPKKDEGYCGSE
jgi:hypothetical protein